MLHYLLALDTFPDDEKIMKEHEELVDEVIKGTGEIAMLLFNCLEKLNINTIYDILCHNDFNW